MPDAIPVLNPEENTSGTRGKPDTNFDFLNQLANQTQTHIGELGETAQQQHDDLSTILAGVNVSIKDVRKRKRNDDILFATQADQLATRSEQIGQSAAEAAADPFHGFKVLFTDTPSIRDWAARHNSVSNELNKLKRRYSASQAEYNFEVTEITNQISIARQQLALTNANIAMRTNQANAVIAQVTSKTTLAAAQLKTMQMPELLAELKDPKGQIPAGMVKDRISFLEKAQAEINSKRATAGKSALELRDQQMDFLKEHIGFIDEDTIAAALLTGKPQREPDVGILITSQMAEVLQPLQQEKQQERTKLIAEMTTNNLQGSQAFAQSIGVFERMGGPGTSVYGRDEKGNITGIDAEALPPELQQLAAAQSNLIEQVKNIDFVLSQNPTNEELVERNVVLRNDLNRQAQDIRDEIVKRAKEIAQEGYNGKETKAAIGQWIEFARIRNETGARGVLVENAASPTNSIMFQNESGNMELMTSNGPGYDKALSIFNGKFQTELDTMLVNEPNLVKDEEGNIDSSALLAAVLRGSASAAKASDAAAARALTQVDPRGQSLIATAALNDWYQAGTNIAIRMMMQNHQNEPETLKALDTFILGTQGLSPDITGVVNADGEETDDVLVLFASLMNAQRTLKDEGALPEDVDLVGEFKNIIFNKSFYQLGEVKNLTDARTEGAAAINRIIFGNAADKYFRAGMQKVIGGVPVGNLSAAREFAELQNRMDSPKFTTFTSMPEQQKTIERFKELRDEIGDESSLESTFRTLQQNKQAGQ